MAARSFSQPMKPMTLHVNAVEMCIIQPGLGVSGEIDPAGFLIDRDKTHYREFTLGQPTDKCAVQIVEVEVVTAIPF
jgi:hypothetical protein